RRSTTSTRRANRSMEPATSERSALRRSRRFNAHAAGCRNGRSGTPSAQGTVSGSAIEGHSTNALPLGEGLLRTEVRVRELEEPREADAEINERAERSHAIDDPFDARTRWPSFSECLPQIPNLGGSHRPAKLLAFSASAGAPLIVMPLR